MKIRLSTFGGWSAPLRRAPLAIDTAELPAEAAAEAERLATAAKAAVASRAVQTESLRARAPEAMTYSITLEQDGREVVLKGSDIDSSPEFGALRDWLQGQARKSLGH